MSQRRYAGTTCFSCRFCSHTIYVKDAPYIGRCSCGGHRGQTLDNDVIRCLTCGKASPRLTERYREHKESMIDARQSIDEHQNTEHRAKIVYDRIQEIEHDATATRGWRAKPIPDDEWQTHELCIEYRALMREWWTLPNSQVSAVLYGHGPNERRTDIWRDAKRKIEKLVKASEMNTTTGWYELPQTTFQFFLYRDEVSV